MSLSVEIRPIHSSDVSTYWPEVAPMIQLALNETDGEWSLGDVYESLIDESRALWLVLRGGKIIAAVTSRIDEYKSGLRVGVIDMAGGEGFKDWSMFTDYISPFYKQMGCAKLEIAGRLGWSRLHTDKGFKIRYYVMRKDL